MHGDAALPGASLALDGKGKATTSRRSDSETGTKPMEQSRGQAGGSSGLFRS
jgi:hypothetical protein